MMSSSSGTSPSSISPFMVLSTLSGPTLSAIDSTDVSRTSLGRAAIVDRISGYLFHSRSSLGLQYSSGSFDSVSPGPVIGTFRSNTMRGSR